MSYDEVIDHLGDFGKYQIIIFLLLCLTSIPCAFHKLAGVFLLSKPNFRCLLPFENATTQYQELPSHLWHLAYPRNLLDNDKFDTCKYYNIEFSAQYLESNSTADATKPTLSCEHYVYEDQQEQNSVLTDWNLVCDRNYLAATSDAMFMFGVLLGSFIFGQLSDKYGRKPIFFASLVIQVVFGILAAIAPDYWTYTVARLVVGSTTSGVFLVAYVIAMEMVGPSKRLFAGIFLLMFFSLGFMLTAVFAYYIRDWRQLQIALTLPGLLFLCYHWIVPESARWLLSKGRKADAAANIQKAAKFNSVNLPADLLDQLLDDNNDSDKKPDNDDQLPTESKDPTVFDLLKYPNLRRKTLLIFFDWFVNSGTYYALSWNTNSLGDNKLLNFVMSGAVEIPAFIILLLTLNRWGRRTILCGCMLVGGLGLIGTVFVPGTMNWLVVLLAMLGKLAITASYGTVYIFTAEQFPTVVRNVGLGASSMVARIGGILAPFFNMLSNIWKPLPMLIFGIMAFIGGLLSLLLPETHNRPTLETIADGEQFGKKTQVEEYLEKGKEMQLLDKMETLPLNGTNANVQANC